MRRLLLACVAVFLAGFAGAQVPASPPNEALAKPVRIQSIEHIVKNIGRSVAFYRDAFAFQIKSPPGAWHRAAKIGHPLEASGAKFRSAVLALPNTETTLVLTEFEGTSGKPLAPRNSDPGACTLSITVKDLDKALHDAVGAGASVVTKGGAPLALGPAMRLIFINDPDGFFIELGTGAADLPTAAGNALSVRVGFTIGDTSRAANFYGNTLGMQFQPPKDFASNKAISDLIAVDDIEFKSSFATLSQKSIRLEFLEFRGSATQARWGQLQDPGTPLIVLAVNDVKGAGEAIVAAGGKRITGLVPSAAQSTTHLFLTDPNEIPLELVKAR
jgi:catechol 2,3-dioxygenase-like lactoylglutathione lyase family enzyme